MQQPLQAQTHLYTRDLSPGMMEKRTSQSQQPLKWGYNVESAPAAELAKKLVTPQAQNNNQTTTRSFLSQGRSLMASKNSNITFQPPQKSAPRFWNLQERSTTPVYAIHTRLSESKFPVKRLNASRTTRILQGSPANLERPDISSEKGQRYLRRDWYSFSHYLPFLL